MTAHLMPVDFTVSFVKQPSRSARHHTLNDLVAHSFALAGVPKQPVGLLRSDGNRPDGITLIPWQSGKSLCWDVTVTCPLAESYVDRAVCGAGVAAEMAATSKEEKLMLRVPLNRVSVVCYLCHLMSSVVSVLNCPQHQLHSHIHLHT